jgi:hypothetical protein
VPLRTLGLGVGLLGPASYPLALLGEVRIKGRIRDERPVSTAQSVPPLSLQPPGTTRSGRTTHSPLTLVRGAEGQRGNSGAGIGGSRTPSRYTRDLNPTVGVPAAGLANRHAALVEGRQPIQDRCPQPLVVTEWRNALGRD